MTADFTLSWTPADALATSYRLEWTWSYDPPLGGWTAFKTIAAPATSHKASPPVQDVPSGGYVYVRVVAINYSGETPSSTYGSVAMTSAQFLQFWDKMESNANLDAPDRSPSSTAIVRSTTPAPLYTTVKFGNGAKARMLAAAYMRLPAAVFGNTVEAGVTHGTLEFWLSAADPSRADDPYVVIPQTDVTKGVYVYRSGGYGVDLSVTFFNQGVGTIPFNTFWTNALTHVAVTWSDQGGGNTLVKAYVDGVEQCSATITTPAWDFDAHNLGHGADGTKDLDQYFDNVKIYNYAKTDFSDRLTEDAS
jgi:hypothetical protein